MAFGIEQPFSTHLLQTRTTPKPLNEMTPFLSDRVYMGYDSLTRSQIFRLGKPKGSQSRPAGDLWLVPHYNWSNVVPVTHFVARTGPSTEKPRPLYYCSTCLRSRCTPLEFDPGAGTLCSGNAPKTPFLAFFDVAVLRKRNVGSS